MRIWDFNEDDGCLFFSSGIKRLSFFSVYCICPNHQDEIEILLCTHLMPLVSWKIITSMYCLTADQNFFLKLSISLRFWGFFGWYKWNIKHTLPKRTVLGWGFFQALIKVSLTGEREISQSIHFCSIVAKQPDSIWIQRIPHFRFNLWLRWHASITNITFFA